MTSPTHHSSTECGVERLPTVELKMPPHQREVFRKDYKPSEYRIKHIAMDFDLSYTNTEVFTDLYMYRANPSDGGPPIGIPCDLILDGEELNLVSPVLLTTNHVTIPENGKKCLPKDCIDQGRKLNVAKNEYKLLSGHQDGKLWINGSLLPTKPDELFKISTHVKIHPDTNTSLAGLFLSGSILCTQCEAEGFRRITFSLDRPDVLSTYLVRLQGDKSEFPVLLCNGNEISEGQCPKNSNQRFVVFEDPHPKPTYLFAVVGGVLALKEGTHIRPDGRPVKLALWCEPSELAQLDWALECVKKAMVWDEKTWNLVYDLDLFNIVAAPSFNCGAMENKSLNIFNSSRLLASKDTSADQNFLDILRVVGHEYFHNWSGNRVTCRDWFQLTLKEGLTVFREQLFGADMGSAAISRIKDVELVRSYQFPEDAGPLKHPIRPESYVVMDNFYTATVYDKGAEVIRLYQTLLGVDGFKKGVRLYFERHDGQAVTCDDFRAAMADANNTNLDQLEEWYLQAGTPSVTVDHIIHDKEKQQCRIKLSQSIPTNPGGAPLFIPVDTGLIGKQSKKEIAPSTVLHLKSKSEEFVINGVEEDFVISLLRNFSAPVRLLHDNSDDDLAFLVAYDTDPFNRYEAGQKLLKRIILHTTENVELLQGKPKLLNAIELPQQLLDAFTHIISTSISDLEFKAALLSFPCEDSLSSEMNPCEPLVLRFAFNYIRFALVQKLEKLFTEIYNHMTDEIAKIPEYKYTPEDAGRRQLRNVALTYLTAPNPTEEKQNPAKAKLAYQHYKNADNMNDKLAAIRCLRHLPSEERQRGFRKFYEYTKDNDGALNKWFAMQTSSDIPNLFEIIDGLRKHPKFANWSNPTRVKAFYVNFTTNTPHFHRHDGKGYQLLADVIIDFDKVNCKSAAPLVIEFSQWKRYSPERQALVRTELERILSTPGISTDSYELLVKTLNA